MVIFRYTRSLRLLAKRAAKPKCPPYFPYPLSIDVCDVIDTFRLLFMTSQGLQTGATLASSSALPTGSEEDSAGEGVVLGPYRVGANH